METVTRTALLAEVSAYLNGLSTFQSDFAQRAPDGTLSQGRFFMRRPGRLRFEYDPPSGALIVSDGFWMTIEDRNLATLDRYPLSETPLALLLKGDVDLDSEPGIADVAEYAGWVRIVAQDPDDPALGSVTLIFSRNPVRLRQWTVLDRQGLSTTVLLDAVKENIPLDPALFVPEERVPGE